jgi:hypothetical protein
MVAARSFLPALIVALGAGCANRNAEPATQSVGASVATAVQAASTCTPGNQDSYVYRPARLRSVAPCIRAHGTIVARSMEADGDIHLQLRLDEREQVLLNAGSVAAGGNLVVEAICQFPPLQADAIRICAANPNPFPGPLPNVGDHVWMEGRYVVEVQHGAWTELHPLYRWGTIALQGPLK